ncbi:MAG: hypothetical protein MUE44_24640 [Oscillatoriaceae cyanobacterium Prado104]|nr:hypothetical protein [Oscillatoriaceae cyanobacterium Prado104]
MRVLTNAAGNSLKAVAHKLISVWLQDLQINGKILSLPPRESKLKARS